MPFVSPCLGGAGDKSSTTTPSNNAAGVVVSMGPMQDSSQSSCEWMLWISARVAREAAREDAKDSTTAKSGFGENAGR
jgi:hypothetical protein